MYMYVSIGMYVYVCIYRYVCICMYKKEKTQQPLASINIFMIACFN